MKRLFFTVVLVVLGLLLLGTAPDPHPLVATASSLKPPQITPPTQAPAIVTTEVVHSTVPQETGVTGDSVAPSGGNGYVMPGNNCVTCAIALTGRGQGGNAGTWYATHSDPRIGDIMIFRPGEQGASSLGHVAVVVSVNGDGTVNVAHCNWPGRTTFRSTGKFY